MENVPEVIGKDNVKHFNKWLLKLESLGYTNYFQILNAKNYCIPQNRRRVFMVSIFGDYAYEFPLKLKLQNGLNKIIEPKVDEKYNLSEDFIKYLTADDTKKYKRKQAFEYTLKSCNEKNIAVALSTRQGRGACDNYIKIKNATTRGYLEAEPGDGVDISTRMHHHRGTVQKNTCQTITTSGGESVGVVIKENEE